MQADDSGLYFAYGSNLNQQDWRQFCDHAGVTQDPLEPLGLAWLPDHRPVYHDFCSSRQGGALDVLAALGHVTPGVLFRVREPGWMLLDRKEGAPVAYQRASVWVLTEDGGLHQATTYQVAPERRAAAFVAPREDYAALIEQALVAWNLPMAAHAQAAEGGAPKPLVRHLFVYGLLQSGYAFGRFLDSHCRREPATAPGRLYDLGSYPAWQPAKDPQERVTGELLSLDDPAIVLKRTDEAEDFVGYDHRSHYQRVLVRARRRTDNSHQVDEELAWCYRYARGLAHAKHVQDGLWRPQKAP